MKAMQLWLLALEEMTQTTFQRDCESVAPLGMQACFHDENTHMKHVLHVLCSCSNSQLYSRFHIFLLKIQDTMNNLFFYLLVYLSQYLSLREHLYPICLTLQCYLYGKQAVSLALPGSTCGMRQETDTRRWETTQCTEH